MGIEAPRGAGVCLFLALARGTFAREAAAQEGPAEAARRDLISEAQRASTARDHARAVDLLTRAAAVRYTPSLREFLAEELLATSSWLRAYVESVTCLREAGSDEHLADRRQILRACARHEAQARPHVGQLVVNVPADAPSLRILVAGAELPRALWGVRYPVTAGVTLVEATAAEGRSFRHELAVPEGQERSVTVSLTAPSAPPAPPPPPPISTGSLPGASPPASQPPPAVVPPQPPRVGPGVGPWVVVGAGAAVLASAGVFFALRQSSVSERDAACPDALCDDAAAQRRGDAADGDARTFNALTNVALGVGAAAVVGGAAWWFFTRPSARPTTSAWIAPQAERVTLGLRGSF